ncbi:MAG: long-chain fatty acid transporter [Thiomonas sp. 13-66-29]|jgi:long-chain fatty acid transport protein|uniref:OmpP1/FadL family transporter n=1 Tax=Thiomonas sp. TaxID=2047785 RepID=UPI000BD9CB1B|nr:outer membrane protein transport protein [Thiomonas sp.]OZB59564.1 MAG: long-chain fatty acid transporter [Thiomonas sp. 13-66-29]
MQLKKLAAALFVAGVIAPGAANATDGYFQPGYSVKSVGMGGVGIALPQDALAAAANPAGMALIGNRVDGGISLFRPNRQADINGTTYSGNDTSNFLIPEIGANYMINPTMSVGLSMYGNGGMNSGYSTIQNSGTGLMNGAGVDLQQMFISPSFAWRVTPTQTIGVAVNLVHQSFRANGLDNFVQASSSPQNLTGNGHDSSNGVGVRIGWIGQLAPGFSLGATYQPKTHMSSFSKYSGLFAGGGSFDIPANYGVGFAWQPNQQWTVAGDVERILYSGVAAIGNTSTTFCSPATYPNCYLLGTSNGPGFGWTDVTVVKLGVAYAVDPSLTLRAGWNHSDNPVTTQNVFFNTIAPGVVKDHLTLGLTYALSNQMEISADYVHAFKNTVTGQAPQFNQQGQMTGAATEALSMYQDTLGVSIGWKF